MAFLQGSPLPSITETTTVKDTAPTGYTSYLENLAKSGSGAMVDPTTGLPKTGQQLVAGLDPLQTAGYNLLPQAVGSFQPGLDAASQSASKAAAGITPERIQALMNPYTSSVVNEMARLSQQNLQRNLLPTMKAGFVGTGGLGSQRYAGALGQTLQNVQSDLTGLQSTALSKGFTDAMKGALEEAELANLAAKTQADIAERQQKLGIEGAGALTKAGAELQKYEQSKLDAPLAIAKEASGLFRGLALPQDETRTTTGPKTRDYYQQSDLSKIAGVLSLVGGAAQGKEGEGLNRILNILSKGGTTASKVISNLLSPYYGASSAAVGQGEIDALKAAGVYDDYQKLIESITNPDIVNEDTSGYYKNIFDSLENPVNYNLYGYEED